MIRRSTIAAFILLLCLQICAALLFQEHRAEREEFLLPGSLSKLAHGDFDTLLRRLLLFLRGLDHHNKERQEGEEWEQGMRRNIKRKSCESFIAGSASQCKTSEI